MSTVSIEKEGPSNFGFGEFRHFAKPVAIVIGGGLLFAISRKVTWGLQEPVFDWRILGLSLTPFLVYLAAEHLVNARPEKLAFVKSTRLPALWICALLIYVAMHVTMLADFVESKIYDTFSLRPETFVFLSLIYVTASTLTILLSKAYRREANPVALLTGYVLCFAFFFLGVLYIPLV